MQREQISNTIQEKILHRETAKFMIRIGISVLILLYITKDIDYQSLIAAFKAMDISLFVSALALNLIGITLWGMASLYSFKPLKVSTSVWQMTKVLLIVRFYSLFLPGGFVSGSIVKWHKLSIATNMRAQSAVFSLFFRLIHMITLLIVTLTGVILSKLTIFSGAVPLAILTLVLAIIFTISLSHNKFIRMLVLMVEWLGKSLSPFSNIAPKITKTLNMCLNFQKIAPKDGVGLFLSAMLGHIVEIYAMLLLARSLGINTFDIFDMAWIRGIVVVIAMLPVALGGLGFREVGMLAALRVHGYPEPLIISFSLLTFAQLLFKGGLGGILELYDIVIKPKANPNQYQDVKNS